MTLKKIIKDFADWFSLKPKLDENKQNPFFNERDAIIILSQSRTIDSKRLKTRIETISQTELESVKQKFINFLQT